MARLYDEFYATKPYAEEARFVSDCFSEAGLPPGGRILDLACGTGGHALELAELGYEVVGVDIADGMLEEARTKASSRGLAVEFLCQDLRQLDVGEGTYDAAVCLFDSLGYLLTDADISAALRRVNRSLKPGGAFVVEAWHGAAMLSGYDRVRVRRFGLPAREIVRVSETEVDVESQSATVSYTVFRQASDGRWDSFSEEHRNRFFFRQDLARLLEGAGLIPYRWLAGYADGPITMETWHLIAVCRKEELPG
ncbi:MAG: class I SAM-dependent methyltransferase [Gaiellaceae bacterium]